MRGTVSGTGAILAGSGFTVAQVGMGRYRIAFDAAFPADPSVVVTAVFGSPAVDAGGGVQLVGGVVDQATPAAALIATFDAGGTLANLTFMFFAIAA